MHDDVRRGRLFLQFGFEPVALHAQFLGSGI